MQVTTKKRSSRRGATLIDVATGSMLLAVLLIPSVHLITESQSSQRRLAKRDIIDFEAEKLIESTKVALSDTAAFNAALASSVDVTGALTVSDGPDLTSRVRVSADTSASPAQLLTIVVDVWHDSNGNNLMDSGETGESLRTQWAAP